MIFSELLHNPTNFLINSWSLIKHPPQIGSKSQKKGKKRTQQNPGLSLVLYFSENLLAFKYLVNWCDMGNKTFYCPYILQYYVLLRIYRLNLQVKGHKTHHSFSAVGSAACGTRVWTLSQASCLLSGSSSKSHRVRTHICKTAVSALSRDRSHATHACLEYKTFTENQLL